MVALPQPADAARLLLLTGVRRDMVLGMKRAELEDLDGREPRWVIPGGFEGRSKSGRAHVVPLSPEALAVLRRRFEGTAGELLFAVTRASTGRGAAQASQSDVVVPRCGGDSQGD
jgi:integrase